MLDESVTGLPPAELGEVLKRLQGWYDLEEAYGRAGTTVLHDVVGLLLTLVVRQIDQAVPGGDDEADGDPT